MQNDLKNLIIAGLSLILPGLLLGPGKPAFASTNTSTVSSVEFQTVVFESYDYTNACFSSAGRQLDYFDYRYKEQDNPSFKTLFNRLESIVLEGSQDLSKIFPEQPDCINLFQQIDLEKYTLIGTRFWGSTYACSVPGSFSVNLVKDDDAKAYRQIYTGTAPTLGCHSLPRHLFWIAFEKEHLDYAIEFEATFNPSTVIFSCDDVWSTNSSCYPTDSPSNSIWIQKNSQVK